MKINFGRLLDNKNMMKLLSLVLAVAIWLVIVIYVSPISRKTVHDVPVSVSQDDSDVLNSMGLFVVDNETATVDVKIRAERLVLSSVAASDIDIVANLSGITAPGTYDVALVGGVTSNYNRGDRYGKGFELDGSDAISPGTIRIRVDREARETFQIVTDIDGLSSPEEYYRDEPLVSPKEVTISGPEADINRIDRCVVSASFSEPLTSSKTVTSEIMLYDAEGNEISKEHLTLGVETADITVPVYKKKELPLNYEYINTPRDFPIDRLEERYSVASVLVAGPETLIDSYDVLDLGFINLSEITPDNHLFPFPLDGNDGILPRGFRNLSGVDTVWVEILTDGMLEANFTIPAENIKSTNVPINYKVTIQSTSIPNVHMVGDPDDMAALTNTDLVAEIDMTSKEVSPGTYLEMPVRISAPGKGLVWATGEYKAIVTVTEK